MVVHAGSAASPSYSSSYALDQMVLSLGDNVIILMRVGGDKF